MIAQRPMNIFALIDEESSLNYTTDETMLTKLKSIHGNNDLFEVTRQGTEVFFVKHFAGDVCYTVDGMLEKNRDTFHTENEGTTVTRSGRHVQIRKPLDYNEI